VLNKKCKGETKLRRNKIPIEGAGVLNLLTELEEK
jgi:hypothetical protein